MVGGISMVFLNKDTASSCVTEAQRQRNLAAIKDNKKSNFANKETCNKFPINRMPRPHGKIYKG